MFGVTRFRLLFVVFLFQNLSSTGRSPEKGFEDANHGRGGGGYRTFRRLDFMALVFLFFFLGGWGGVGGNISYI